MQRLVPGSMVLGQISEINRDDLALALPNNLTGFVPLASVSDKFTERIEEVIVQDEEAEDQNDVKDLDLKSYFFLGQYLRAYVVSTSEEATSGVKSKRHIELSINPRKANSGLKIEDIVAGSMLQASVSSVEDHGLVMNLGLTDGNIRGFISSKQIGRSITDVRKGAVFLSLVTKQKSNSNVINLCADPLVAGDVKKANFLADAPSIDSYLPGTAVEIMISDVSSSGVTGKVMGLLDVTADFVHSGAAISGKELEKMYKRGTKVKGRIICTFPASNEKKLGVSLLDHVILLYSKTTASSIGRDAPRPSQKLLISTIIPEAKVIKVHPGLGLFLEIGARGIPGFVHISKIADHKIDALLETTGPYKLGSLHRARVIGYNALDALFVLSMEEKVLNQPFLRIEDIRVGQAIEGTIEKTIIETTGLTGLIVRLAEGISGLVPDTHFADVRLQHPERRFKEGGKVTGRVLSTNLDKRQIRLTLKKSLMHSESDIWESYQDLSPGMQAPGTIFKILSSGAVVQFYGPVKAFLPVSEMSESYIADPKQHFRIGQVVNVHILSVNASDERLLVSCRDPATFSAAQQEAMRRLQPGDLVCGTVSEKTGDEIVLELEGTRLKALLHMEHLVDSTAAKSLASFKRIRAGQTMRDLLLLSKQEAKHLLKLTSKPSLLKAAKDGRLLKLFEDVSEGSEVQGFIKNVTSSAIFVQFADELTGLLSKSQLPDDVATLPGFGVRQHESITARVLSVDNQQQRFFLTKKVAAKCEPANPESQNALSTSSTILSNPVDGTSTTLEDYVFGKSTKAKIQSIKETQLNVQLADGVQGRVDVSEVFDDWAAITNRKNPLQCFYRGQELPVRILGIHDSRNHRFLPITNRGKAPVFELTAKPNCQTAENLDILTLDKVQKDVEYIVYINNVANDYVWVNLSPNVRGRIKAIDVSERVSLINDLAKNFPVGCALKAKVTNIDIEKNRLDLSAKTSSSSTIVSFQDVKPGMILPGRVTRVTDRQINVQLSENVSGVVHLVDLTDDFSTANPTVHSKNQTVTVCVKAVDPPNKKITLSTRPSKVLSSSSPVQDPDISSITELRVNDICRGFIKNVANNGVFVSLSSNVTAYIRISDLSDSYLKDWKAGFEIDQLVRGKIIAVDPKLSHVQMSLRESHLEKDYKAPLTYASVSVGQTITGKIRKVTDYGVFIVIDDSANVSGLCHRSEISDQKSADPNKLYEEGDLVKARVIKVDRDRQQISFSLKASHFANDKDEYVEGTDEEDELISGISDSEDFQEAVGQPPYSENDGGQRDINELSNVDDDPNEGGVGVDEKQQSKKKPASFPGLSAGFDWTGQIPADEGETLTASDVESEVQQPKKKRRKRAEIQIDRTGDLDANGPQSTADFERLLLGQPNSSRLWLSYMAFQLELSEVDTARDIAERALRTMNIREQEEKLNVWIALLNLENTYGDAETLEEVFKRACQYNDSQDIHERLLSIYIQSANNDKADELFQATLKKHSQTTALYLNYATFLMTTLEEATRARELLPRALQSLPPHTHLDTTSKFAQLEFTSPHGDPERGRTMFEGLISTWPKRLDLWNVLLDLELKQGEGDEKRDRVRGVFERIIRGKLNARKAKWVFKRWLEYEEIEGDSRSQERVKAKAADFVKQLEKEKSEKGSH